METLTQEINFTELLEELGAYFAEKSAEHDGTDAFVEQNYQRLKEHIAKKEFWHEVIFFVSKDENLTKAHVKYLEKVIREEPAYWLWSHKRWKFKPEISQ
ncbi:MAG: hypothetical protein EOO07_34755 [Chitinophagaceae bacterium]|nr:MAG: hypothetical protein EOO07_34755 [Chitinophagaceae bacterium]